MLLTDQGRFTVTNHIDEVELWRAFLTIARPRLSQPLGCVAILFIVLAAGISGGVLGALGGNLLKLLWPQPFIVASLTFVGFADGVAISGSYVSGRYFGKKLRREQSLVAVYLALIVLGIKTTGGDWSVRGPLVAANALLVTLAIYLFIHRPLTKADAASKE